MSAVLDASAVLALLNGEPGGERVEAALAGASISAVNLAEVLGRLRRAGVGREDCARAVACLATARRRRQSALTADRAWLRLDIGVRIVAIR